MGGRGISTAGVWGGHVFWLTGRGCWIGNEGDVESGLLVMGFHMCEDGDTYRRCLDQTCFLPERGRRRHQKSKLEGFAPP